VIVWELEPWAQGVGGISIPTDLDTPMFHDKSRTFATMRGEPK